jgi:tetratricopeptide (TPR) repeat protein
MREDDRAIGECRNALEMDPNFARAHGNLASIYQHKRMYEQSFQQLETAMTLEGEDTKVTAALRKAYESSGIKGLWRKEVELGEERSKRDYVDAYGMVLAYANLGEKDKALAWLQTAYEQRSPAVVGLKVDPGLDPLRSDPRFQTLLHHIGLLQ